MLIRPKDCEGCPLNPMATGFSQPTGTGRLGVMVIAEALGEHEAKLGRGLVEWAPAGSIFERALHWIGVDRGDLVIWNTVACRPPGNKLEHQWYEYKAAEHCRVHMDRVVMKYKPRVIVTLGNIPLKYLTGLSGKHRTVGSLRGYVLRSSRYPEIMVVPTYHPSFIQRGASSLFRTFTEDIQRAILVAAGGDGYDLDPVIPEGFNLKPTVAEVKDLLERLRSQPQLMLGYDIETNRSVNVDESELFKIEEEESEDVEEMDGEAEWDVTSALTGPIIQFQASIGEGHALAIPWTEEFIPALREMLALPNPKIGQNIWRFDDVLLQMSGMRINGVRSDTLWAWHHYQPDLPAHLQWIASQFGQRFPWKHLVDDDLAFYGAMDVEVLHRIWNGLPKKMQGLSAKGFDDRCEIRTVAEGYERHVEQLNPILERMSIRGIPINKEKLDAFGRDLDVMKQEMYAQLEAAFPEELKVVEHAYKKEPKSTEGLALRTVRVSERAIRIEEQDCTCKRGCKKCNHTRRIEKKIKGEKIEVERELWCRLRPFAPSPAQIGAYIAWKGDKPQTRATKKGEGSRTKSTTDKTALETLFRQTGDTFYINNVKYRNFQKLRSTYVGDDDITRKIKESNGKKVNKGWQPASDGRVHPVYLFRPATQQLSSTSPNCHNAIGEKAGELGIRFKSCIEASPGHTLVEVDYTGLHAYMLGFLANDASYMRLSSLGIHDYLAASLLAGKLPEWMEQLGTLKGKKRASLQADLDRIGLGTVNLLELYEWVKDVDTWLALPDDELGTKLAGVKKRVKVYRSKIKPAVHGYGFGLGAFKLFKTNPENFASVKEAQAPLDMLNQLFPKVADYRERVKQRVDKDRMKVLVTPFGAPRFFQQVYAKKPVAPGYPARYGEKIVVGAGGRRWKIGPGLDAEKVIAFLPAACSFGYKKDVMLRLAAQGLDEKYRLINEVHDSLLFEIPDELLEEAVPVIVKEMTAPSKCLVSDLAPDGLSCKVEVSIGKNWGEMKGEEG